MQEFLTNNTVSCNLMSLTGYRTLVILSALMDSPKSNEEINNCLLGNQYINEKFSSDTLRIYINSLRSVGCEISKAYKTNKKKYELSKHPFSYNIPKSQLKAISKIYKNTYNNLTISELIEVENLLNQLAKYASDDATKEYLQNISFLKTIDKSLLNELLHYCKNKNQITILYNSPKSGPKEIGFCADKLEFKSEKLYLWGNNLSYNEYSFLRVDKIIKICNIKLQSSNVQFPDFEVVYEVSNIIDDFLLEAYEEVLESSEGKLLIKSKFKNEFSFLQRVLYLSANCKIVSPESFKNKIVSKLKAMEKAYENI